MRYAFNCHGHENITAKHRTTLEFTKDISLGLEGDCIVGVRADFSLQQLKKFIESLGNNNKITITIETLDYNDNEYNNKNSNKTRNNENNRIINNKNNNMIIEKNNIKNNIAENKIIEKINAEINPGFDSNREMVIRKSDFADKRTFAIKADKGACDVNKKLAAYLKCGGKFKVDIITC